MMSDMRVVRIRDFARLREADEEILIRYLNNPSPSTVMIFIADELDKRKEVQQGAARYLYRRRVRTAEGCGSKSVGQDASEGIEDYGRRSVLSEIIRLVGTDVQTLFNELEKLASAAADTGRITLEHVDELIGRSRELSNFRVRRSLACR